MIPIREFAPDASAFDAGACDRLENVLPFVGGFAPLPSLSTFSDATGTVGSADSAVGAFLARNDIGTYHLFVGTGTHLFVLNSSLGWDDVSDASGYLATQWSFCQFGKYVIATNGSDEPQYIDISGSLGTFADLTSEFLASHCSVIGDFLMFGGLLSNRRQVRWSGLNDPTFFTPRQRGSDFQEFPDGGAVTGFSSGEKGIVIFQETAIREGALALATPLVMTFAKTVDSHGATAGSIVTTEQGAFYLSHDGFYLYRVGAPPLPIGEGRVNKTFLDDLNGTGNVRGVADPQRKMVYWAYKSSDNEDVGTSFDKIVGYHYGADRWVQLTPTNKLIAICQSVKPGDATFADKPTFAAFDATNNKLGLFNGDAYAAGVTTKAIEFESGRRTYVSGFRPATDAPTVTGSVEVKDKAGASSWTAKTAYSLNRTGLIPARAAGRLHRFKIDISSATTWTTLTGFDPVTRPEGLA